MTASLATARPSFHVDVSVGDPITPEPQIAYLPCIVGGTIAVRGYPLSMVHAEKIVTAIARGTANSRWRDFADMYTLTRRHPVDGTELTTSIREVAQHRGTRLTSLSTTLDGSAPSASSTAKHGGESSASRTGCRASSVRS